jgi:hypothetical protein
MALAIVVMAFIVLSGPTTLAQTPNVVIHYQFDSGASQVACARRRSSSPHTTCFRRGIVLDGLECGQRRRALDLAQGPCGDHAHVGVRILAQAREAADGRSSCANSRRLLPRRANRELRR